MNTPGKKNLKHSDKTQADPITLEVVRNALVAIVMEMTDNLIRTAYSPIAAEIKDFSIGLLDANGDSIAQAPNGVPMFCADLNATIKRGLVIYAEEGFADGDIILSNDTETNGQHVNNMAAYSPIIANGEVVAFAAVRSHWIDVGGVAVGSMPGNSRDIFSEGIQIPFMKVYRAGKPDESVLRLIKANSRFPELVMGDMRAQISACRLGEQRFLDLIKRYGKDSVKACIHRIWDEAEILTRAAVEKIPDGAYQASCVLDNDGLTLNKPIPLKVKVIVAGSDMTIDFSEMSPPVQGPFNSRASGTIARVAFKYLTTPNAPITEGGFRNLKIVCPEGTILSAPPNAPMAWFNMAVVSTIDLVLRAVQPAMPEAICAGSADNIGMSHISGIDPRTGKVFQTFAPFLGGWGARPNGDGPSAVVSLVQGDVRFMPIEVQETVTPIRVLEFSLHNDSGGAGKYRGGLGIVLGREVLTDAEFHGRFERTKDAPWGFAGGQPGVVTHSVFRHEGEPDRPAPLKCESVPLKKGDREFSYTSGGGGIGHPWTRDSGSVKNDVRNGYVSIEAAREQYGVILNNGTLDIDETATIAKRKILTRKKAT